MNATKLLSALLLGAAVLGASACSGSSQNSNATGQQSAGLANPERILRRLTRFEYNNTVQDLLGLNTDYTASLPPDQVVDVFDNNAAALTVGPLLAEQYQTLAETIAAAAAMNLTNLVPCDPTKGDATCAQGFINTFGKLAFRRPLTATEAGRYANLYSSIATANGFTTGIETLIAAFLQSPNFLYRTELGTPSGDGTDYKLTPYEIASELSYFLWGSMPDAELIQKADSGALGTQATLVTEATRLLASPRSRPMLDHFIGQWLLLDLIATSPKDATTFPDYTAAISADMVNETTAFFDHVIHAGTGKLPELFTANYSLMADGLATFYGLPISQNPADANGMRLTTLPSLRGGVLTHGSILATQAKPITTSPTLRGKLVRERLLCQDLPPPPPGVNVQLPPVQPNETTRQLYLAHESNAVCASCHSMMDPIGFGFEGFDAVGRPQSTQNGQTIDQSGNITNSPHTSGTFVGLLNLQSKLAASPDVQSCFATQWFRYAYGIQGDISTQAQQTQVTNQFVASQLSISQLILALVQAKRFTLRIADPDVQGTTTQSSGNADLGQTQAAPPDAGTAPPPPPAGNYQAQVVTASTWDTGFCDNVTVTNTGTTTGNWSVTFPVPGTITNLWNATSTPAGADLTFVGVSYNQQLAPNATATFGFCASK